MVFKNNNYTKKDLEDILDNLPVSIWLIDSNGQYIYANKCFCNAMGTEKEVLLNGNSKNISSKLSSHFKIDNKKLFNNEVDNLNECAPHNGKWIKSFRKLIISSENNSKKILGIMNDVSSQKNQEISKYSKLENKLELFLDTAADLYCIVDYDGTFKKVNNKFSEYLGWTDDELYKMKYQDLIHPEDYSNSLTCRINAQRTNLNKGYGLINRYKCKNGEYKTFSWNWNYIISENQIILTGKNITDELRLKDEQAQLKKKIELETLKTNFFANISHEFRTPINIILTTIQLLSVMNQSCTCTENKKKLKKYCRGIKQNSYRLLRLVNNLIEMTKIDQGYTELRTVNCNIVSLIEDIVLSISEHIKNKKRHIIFDTEEEEIITAVDPDKIQTIVLNLLSNAIKFTNDNGNIKVYISKDNKNNNVVVSVQDDGREIDKQYSKMIFDRFTQADNLLNRPCEGSGLGLALAKSFVDCHKGDIWVNTNYKNGAEIIFTIPIIQCNNTSANFRSKTLDTNIERYNIEFSDIYNLN